MLSAWHWRQVVKFSWLILKPRRSRRETQKKVHLSWIRLVKRGVVNFKALLCGGLFWCHVCDMCIHVKVVFFMFQIVVFVAFDDCVCLSGVWLAGGGISLKACLSKCVANATRT